MLTAVGGARRGACRTLLCAASARRVVVRLCDAPPSVSQVYLRRESVLKRSIRIHHFLVLHQVPSCIDIVMVYCSATDV